MPPIILVLLQALFLILLYVFVARAVRAVVRDVNRAAAPARVPSAAARPRPAARPSAPADRRTKGRARELVVHSPGDRPRVIALDGREVSFGRGDDCTVPLADSYASERHARVYPSDGEWFVSDLGSTNGTYLNKAKVTSPTPIQPGDQLGIGKTVVEVRK